LPLRIGALAAIMDHYFVGAQGAIKPRDRP
jgi:hypothetical protein